jgi:hypothetical protein
LRGQPVVSLSLDLDDEWTCLKTHGDATGAAVAGFRGPGFSTSVSTLEVLGERNYRFDATAFPNVLNPLARA